MSKKLPYFKFELNEWENGNIQMCSRESKGLFIDLCVMYWSRIGDLPYKLAVKKLCFGNDKIFDVLITENIFSIKNENVVIDFLDEQLSQFNLKSKVNSENAKSRWENTPERIKGDIVYVIKCWDDKEEFIKIGSTSTSVNRRFSGKIPYQYEAIIIDFYDHVSLESQYEKIAKGCEYVANKNFSGYNECYNINCINKLLEFAKNRNAKFVRKEYH